MAFLSSMNIIGSGLTAQQLRLDVVSENIANLNTTRTENGDGAYRRKTVTFEAQGGRDTFRNALARARGTELTATGALSAFGGVRVTQIEDDTAAPRITFDPDHPDANDQGYVELPNVDLVKEISDAMAATQAFSANITALNVLKTVAARALDIGK